MIGSQPAPARISPIRPTYPMSGYGRMNSCPFGHGWCGVGAPCPLHDALASMAATAAAKLKKTNFAAFAKHPKQPA